MSEQGNLYFIVCGGSVEVVRGENFIEAMRKFLAGKDGKHTVQVFRCSGSSEIGRFEISMLDSGTIVIDK